MQKKVILGIFASLLCGFHTLQAQDQWGAWTSLQVNKSWQRYYTFFRAEYRSTNNFDGIDCYFLRPGVGYKLAPWLKADIAYDYLYKPGGAQHRWLLSVTGTLRRDALSVSLRERYVGGWNIGNGDYSNILRSYLKAQYSIAMGQNNTMKIAPYIAIEIYAWDKWKMSHHFVGASLSKGMHKIDLFYAWNVYANKTHADHLVGVGYDIDL